MMFQLHTPFVKRGKLPPYNEMLTVKEDAAMISLSKLAFKYA